MEEKMIYAHTGFAKSDSEAVDTVNHPPHYQGDIECIDAMKAMAKGCKVDTHQAYCWQMRSSTFGDGLTRMVSRTLRKPSGI